MNIHPKFVIGLMLFIFFMVTGCTNTAAPIPTLVPTLPATFTAVPTHMPTPIPSATETPAPTDTAIPTPTALAKIVLGERLIVEAGGFSFQPIEGYETDVQAGSVFMADETGAIIFSITGVTDADLSGKTAQDMMNELLAQIADVSDGELVQGEPYAVVIGGQPGTAVDLTGQLFGRAIAGEAVYTNPIDNQIFFALGAADLAGTEDLWANNGRLLFAAMLDTVQFFAISSNSGSDGSSTATGLHLPA